MAVKKIATIQTFSGESGDVKPTTGVPVGSTFFETDTHKTFTYNGSSWDFHSIELDKAISKLIDKSVSVQSQEIATSLAAGANEIVTFTPPAGKLWHFIDFKFHAPAPEGAASGDHTCKFFGPSEDNEIIQGTSGYASILNFSRSEWRVATTEKFPTDEANLGIALTRQCWDNSNPLKIQYFNDTNVAQTGTRFYEAVLLEEYAA